MDHTKKHGDGDETEKQGVRQFWTRIKTPGLRMLFAFGAVLILIIIVLAFIATDLGVRATILAAGIPAVLTFVVVVIQASVSKQMAEIMDRQEAEMTLQRKIAYDQWQAMRDGLTKTQELLDQNKNLLSISQRQANTAKAQAAMMRESIKLTEKQLAITADGLELTEEMFYISERAYMGIVGLPEMSTHQLKPGEVNGLIFNLFNGGRTPAFNVRFAGRLHESNEILTKEMRDGIRKEIQFQDSESLSFFLPNQKEPVTLMHNWTSAEMHKEWQANRLYVYILIRIMYEDVRYTQELTYWFQVTKDNLRLTEAPGAPTVYKPKNQSKETQESEKAN